jgi:RNA polymerase sigma factor (sigma-70 family)
MRTNNPDMLTVYFQEITRTRLLTPAEEQVVAQEVQRTRRAYCRTMLATDYLLKATLVRASKVSDRTLRVDRILEIPGKLRLAKRRVVDEAGYQASILRRMLDENLRSRLDRILAVLNPRERELIRLRFGFDDGQARTLRDIGEILQVSRERIRQIEQAAMKKLRQPTLARNLVPFLEGPHLFRSCPPSDPCPLQPGE